MLRRYAAAGAAALLLGAAAGEGEQCAAGGAACDLQLLQTSVRARATKEEDLTPETVPSREWVERLLAEQQRELALASPESRDLAEQFNKTLATIVGSVATAAGETAKLSANVSSIIATKGQAAVEQAVAHTLDEFDTAVEDAGNFVRDKIRQFKDRVLRKIDGEGTAGSALSRPVLFTTLAQSSLAAALMQLPHLDQRVEAVKQSFEQTSRLAQNEEDIAAAKRAAATMDNVAKHLASLRGHLSEARESVEKLRGSSASDITGIFSNMQAALGAALADGRKISEAADPPTGVALLYVRGGEQQEQAAWQGSPLGDFGEEAAMTLRRLNGIVTELVSGLSAALVH